MATTYLNGKLIETAFFNGVDLDKILFNNKIVFQKSSSLILPQGTTEINLQEFIESENRGSITAFIIENNFIQPRIVTGDLSTYEVTFINNGEIRGLDANKDALHLTTPITLINNGYIRAGGGDGGQGGYGEDDSTTSSGSDSGGWWKARWGIASPCIEWYDGPLVKREYGSKSWVETYRGPITINGKSWYRDASPSGQQAVDASGYGVSRSWSSTKHRDGGRGGDGGQGQTFDKPISYGKEGYPSSPSGGNSGGAGGTGGNWGIPGVPGSRGAGPGEAGEAGESSGYAIVGTTYLTAESITGNLDGTTVEASSYSASTSGQIAVNVYNS